jgi:hypothetical protein
MKQLERKLGENGEWLFEGVNETVRREVRLERGTEEDAKYKSRMRGK